MFDNVGKNLDDEAGKRTFASMVITSATVAFGIAFTLGLAAYKTVEAVEGFIDDGDMVELIMDDEAIDEAPPPPPPPPPPPAAADAEEEEEEDEDTEDIPDEMVEEVKELDKEPEKEVKSQKQPKGSPGGVEGGVEGGVVGGVIGGVEGGVIGGQLGGVRVFHHRELEVKKRILPGYPEAAKPLNLGDQRCKVQVFIDEKGIPYDAKVEDCPKVFHQATREGILKWRWYPPKADRQKVKARTTIVVNFKLK